MFGFLETSLLLGDFVVVYLAFRCKHLLADYFLQTSWMAQGKAAPVHWLAPLSSHAAIHGIGTMSIALAFAPSLWWLGLVDVIVHALIRQDEGVAGLWWSMAAGSGRLLVVSRCRPGSPQPDASGIHRRDRAGLML